MLEKQKADLRKEIRGQLRLLPEEEKEILDRQIAERVLTLPAVTDAGAVYGYASLKLGDWDCGDLKRALEEKIALSAFQESWVRRWSFS